MVSFYRYNPSTVEGSVQINRKQTFVPKLPEVTQICNFALYLPLPMKKKIERLEPITKTEASYEKLMLQMTSKLLYETRENNALLKEHFGGDARNIGTSDFRRTDKTTSGKRVFRPPDIPQEDVQNEENSPDDVSRLGTLVDWRKSRPNLVTPFTEERRQSRVQMLLQSLQKRMRASEEINTKLLERIDGMKYQTELPPRPFPHDIKIEDEINLIEKALVGKIDDNNNSIPAQNQKKSYVILSEILPYSDRREMKVKFKISDIVGREDGLGASDMRAETSEWLGMVYRATASICWNTLLNNSLNFDEVKILFTENIVFNFIEFMNELIKMGKQSVCGKLIDLVNEKSVDILEFLCRQYPQTKIEAPNVALRALLPQIDNQGRVKYDLVSQSGLQLSYQEDGDYTPQIMRMMNFLIDRTDDQFAGFLSFMKGTFDEIFVPVGKRRKAGERKVEKGVLPDQDDVMYRDKVKSYSKYLIGRKISKNTVKYTEQEIEDGIFFVKSSAILRIITKWVEELLQYFTDPQAKIKNSYSENKDHGGILMYISALLKNGVYKQILKDRQVLFDKLKEISKECYKMELLLTSESFTSDSTQVHLSKEQISVGMYCSNLKSAISSYIGSQLNELIHYLLKIPRAVNVDDLGNNLEDFKTQARKDLQGLNLVTFKVFDLLRCKCHSNEEEIIWIVEFLLQASRVDKDHFNIVRIKDRLHLGTRDIMINAQINKSLVCEIQLSVTSNTDKKQELLDQYNHFLYELKRSKLGPITENVSIWSTLEQRYAYFEQLMKQKSKEKPKGKKLTHECGNEKFTVFNRPIICQCCSTFFSIPKTCLLNVVCQKCSTSLCGECYYYNFLNADQRKLYIFDKYRLLKQQVMGHLLEYTDFVNRPLPPTGFFIKKKFLKKEMSFYMAIEKNKDEKIKDAPSIELIVVQTIIRSNEIVNRQVNKKEIEARLQKGEFFVKNYQKSELNDFIIFYFDKKEKENKKMLTLKDIQAELQKKENHHVKVLSLVRQPSYIQNLRLLKKDTEKMKEMNGLSKVVKEDKITLYWYGSLIILAQACVKGSVLRAEITKKVNSNALKSFAEKESDIVSMEFKNMTNEFEELSTRMKPKLYNMFCKNIKKLFLDNGNIASIKCFGQFPCLQFVAISQNKLMTLEGIQTLKQLRSFMFDSNTVQSLLPFSELASMKYISGNINQISSLDGLQKLSQLRQVSFYQNRIASIEELRNKVELRQLYLRDNPITNLAPVSTLKEITKLFIGKTKIIQLPSFAGLTKLKSLSLEYLQLTEIPDFGDLEIEQLYLSHNIITRLSNLQRLQSLVTLHIADNQIQKIENLRQLDCLQKLKLQRNKIKVIEGIKHLDSLKVLNLKFNPIEDLGELIRFQISFEVQLTEEMLSETAKKQRAEIETVKENTSSGDD